MIDEGQSAMRDDIAPNSIVRLHLIGRVRWTHTNGAVIEAGDYDGYRALTPSKERRVFLALQSGDASGDWLDITDHVRNFIVSHRDNVPTRLSHKLGLSQSPGTPVMKRFATRTRELHQQQQGRTLDQAAMMAAHESFPAEFQPAHFAGANHAIEPLLAEIEKL
jgi:hypothetical protein